MLAAWAGEAELTRALTGESVATDETGAPRRLTDLLADGPVVLFFYPPR